MHVILRHTTNGSNKKRPEGFDRKTLFNAFMTTLTNETVHIVLDAKPGEPHFLYDTTNPLIVRNLGSDGASMRFCLELASKLIGTVVFLEDDYAVAPGWQALVEDGLQFGSYVSLYDHPDKYSAAYKGLPSQIYKGSRHWRTVPSTTNSFAVRASTLMDDMEIHLQYADMDGQLKMQGRPSDHEKFLTLWTRGRQMLTCMPGAWSHEEMAMQTDVVGKSPTS